MFIKKDLRKIKEILVDSEDTREELKLSKRPAEFCGNLNVLCRESEVRAFDNLKVLNLYDNCLVSIAGIGLLGQTPIEEINLGCNQLSSLPLEFGSLGTLQRLWLDDNKLEKFPVAVCQLRGLTNLRLSGNSLISIPPSISSLQCLESLAIDNNALIEFPMGVLQLTNLQHLWLRQNKLYELPDNLSDMVTLETLSISSNELCALPDCLASLSRLKKLYANGNQLTVVPDNLCHCPAIETINLANNKITSIPASWIHVWGQYDEVKQSMHHQGGGDSGSNAMVTDSSQTPSHSTFIQLIGNPIVQLQSIDEMDYTAVEEDDDL